MNVTVWIVSRYVVADANSASSIATCIPTRNRLPIWTSSCRSAGASIAQSIGGRSRSPFSNAPNYPRMSPFTGMRMDSYPKDGTHPGSDLGLMQEQLLDLFKVSYGLMMPLLGRGRDERNVEFGAAMATAANEWEAQVWCDREPRLKAGVQIPLEYTEAAIKEIEKRAGDRRFTHVMIPPRGLEPLGRRRYWPILEACAANGFSDRAASRRHQRPSLHRRRLAVVLSRGAPVLSAEQGGAGHLAGDRRRVRAHPQLRVALVEGGFAWLPSLSWRLDKHYKRLRDEVPHLKRLPSEYIRDNIWVTTQPIEEPERPEDLLATCEWIGWDRIMFSTDYPHWDQDDPRYAFKAPLTEQQKRMVFRENALAFYGLE